MSFWFSHWLIHTLTKVEHLKNCMRIKGPIAITIVNGLGKWASSVVHGTTKRSARLKTQQRISKRLSRGKSLLSKKGTVSDPGESAAVHIVQTDLSDFGDKIEMSDNDPAVVRTVENLSVAGSDTSAVVQEEEARTVGGTPSL